MRQAFEIIAASKHARRVFFIALSFTLLLRWRNYMIEFKDVGVRRDGRELFAGASFQLHPAIKLA